MESTADGLPATVRANPETLENIDKREALQNSAVSEVLAQRIFTDAAASRGVPEGFAQCVGSRCEVAPGARRGTVRFAGCPGGLPKPLIAVELDLPQGDDVQTGGAWIDGVVYFEPSSPDASVVWKAPAEVVIGNFPPEDLLFDSDEEGTAVDIDFAVVDAHIHLSEFCSGGLQNPWLQNNTDSFRRDWTEEHYLASVAKGRIQVKGAVYVQCFNAPAVEEARWVLRMIEDPASVVVGLVAEIEVQKGARVVEDFLSQLRNEDGHLPRGLKGARMVFMATDNNSPDACLEPTFFEGLKALGDAGLLWEFCCNPSMAPQLAECCAAFPEITFIIDHLAHNGNVGGELSAWGPAITELGKLPNVYAKMGAVEEWDVSNPDEYMDHAIKAFGFERIIYESNWFVSEAMGEPYDKTAMLLLEACRRAKATKEDLLKVFVGNACKVYSLDF